MSHFLAGISAVSNRKERRISQIETLIEDWWRTSREGFDMFHIPPYRFTG